MLRGFHNFKRMFVFTKVMQNKFRKENVPYPSLSKAEAKMHFSMARGDWVRMVPVQVPKDAVRAMVLPERGLARPRSAQGQTRGQIRARESYFFFQISQGFVIFESLNSKIT